MGWTSQTMNMPPRTASGSGAVYGTEMIIKMSPARSIPRGAYPCGCRYCKDLARAAREPEISRLAAIDIYDLPDGVVDSASDYFH
jgi:hypothetical protein